MLYGRASEQAAIDELLEHARAGQGGALVLRGEAGIGKSALLDFAASRAGTMRVLRTAGVEPEFELGHATMHRLLLPLLDGIEALPPAQAGALDVVFGRSLAPAPERFLVALATLSLLSDAAQAEPLLCVVDDVHWADQPSLDVLAFVARRLLGEPIAVLLAARSDAQQPLALDRLPELALTGLDQESARTVLRERGATPADHELLLRIAAGNPLALRELPSAIPPGGPTGEPLPLVDRLHAAFVDRLHGRDEAARWVLLLAAADGTGRASVLHRAAGGAGLDEVSDLLVVEGQSVRFRHPLVRSAVYHAATATQRRAAHRAVAEALEAEPGEEDRRAWHRGQAAEGQDETVAAELEQAAMRANHRAGPASAASTLTKAAELTPDADARARRLAAAAAAYWHAGDARRAVERLTAAEAPSTRVPTAMLRALIELRAGNPDDALRLLRPVMPDALHGGQTTAVEWLMLFGEAGFHADDAGAWDEVVAALTRLPLTGTGSDEVLVRLFRAVAEVRAGAQVELADADVSAVHELTDPGRLCWAGGMFWGLGDQSRGRWLRRTAMERAYALGAVGTLAWVLTFVVTDELAAGRYGAAEGYAEEGNEHAAETGQPNLGCWFRAALATIASVRGREAEARKLAEEVLAEAGSRNLTGARAQANRALGLLHLAAGRAEQALAHLRFPAGTVHPGQFLHNVPEMVEAAYRMDEPALAEEPLRMFTRWAAATGSPDLLALAARCEALTTGDEEAFQRALALHPADRPLDLARTRLLYGEHLRRARRRAEAKTLLRDAMSAFTSLGATVWAERAREELRATGEATTAHTPDTLATLTAQEQRIARAVACGSTNREIAAQLFLSTRTIDYHVRKIFQKLGISSRVELTRLLPLDS